MRKLWAHRDARLYISGQILSTFGDSALWLALGIWIKMLTGSASAAGLSFFMFALGTLGAPAGGLIADRVRRRPLLITANLATAALVSLLLLVQGRDQVWLIYLVMFGYGLSAGVLGPAQSALLQTLVDRDLLGEANSALQTAQWGLRLITPLVGAGLLTTFGATPVIIGDVATFLVAVATLLAVRVREEPPQRGAQRWWAETAAGALHIMANPALRRLAAAGALSFVAFGFSETAIFAVVSEGLHRSDDFLAIMITAQGVGAIAAGITATTAMRRLGEGRLVAVALSAASAGFLLQVSSSTVAALAGMACVGWSLPWLSVGIKTLFQRRTPPELMGRADAALGLALSLPQTLSIAVGAALIAVLDYRIMLLAMTGLAALSATYLLLNGTDPRHASGYGPSAAPADAQ